MRVYGERGLVKIDALARTTFPQTNDSCIFLGLLVSRFVKIALQTMLQCFSMRLAISRTSLLFQRCDPYHFQETQRTAQTYGLSSNRSVFSNRGAFPQLFREAFDMLFSSN